MRASFYILTGGFLTGVLWRSFFSINLAGVSAILLGTVCIFLITRLLSFHSHILYGVLFSLAVVAGVMRTEFAYVAFHEKEIFPEGETIVATGTVASEVDVRDEHAVMYVALDTDVSKKKTRLRVITPQYPEFVYGERVLVRGVVHKPESFETESGRVFDYPGYLMKENIQYELKKAEVESLREFQGSPYISALLSWKKRWLDTISLLIPEPSASLAGGVVVGAKRSLGENWLAAFRDAGIIHIVVLSGYNLTLIANSITRAAHLLPRTIGLGLGVVGVTSFALMVGAGATVLRASIMAIIGMFAVYIHRPYLLLRALILAGVCMVLWNPFVLVFDTGFQLSFLATFGLIFVSPFFMSRLGFVPETLQLRGIVSATLATQLTVLPLLVYQIGTVSLVAPIVNVLVLPFVPLVMAVSFIAGHIGMVSILLATPFAWIGYVLLEYMFLVVHLFSKLPFAFVSLPRLPWWMLVLSYLVPLLLVYMYKTRTTPTDEYLLDVHVSGGGDTQSSLP